MDRRLLIIKTGSTFDELAQRRGDFEDWMLEGAGVAREQSLVVDVTLGEALPAPDEVCGAVITGSHAMVTDRVDWSEATAAWLAEAVRVEAKVLGVCYGHQLLAHALGGLVHDMPEGREVGTLPLRVHQTACEDPLFGGLPPEFLAQVSHAQSVNTLPEGALLLASSEADPHQAFRVGPSAWGVQFHPEFDRTITRAYILGRREALAAQGLDVDCLAEGCVESPNAASLLRRFSELALATRTE